jgi:AcrR family transcriptional regulator
MATAETTRRGQRQSSLPTPEAIRTAATTLFSRNGFAGTSVREIARVAGVDPALVIRHFGSKEALFIETVPVHGPFDEVLYAPLDDFGERIVEFILNRLDRHSFNVFLEVLRASGSDAIRQRMGEMMIASFSKLNDQLSGPDASLRTRLVAAQVTGLLTTLAGSRQDLCPKDRRSIIEIYGAAIQSTIAAKPRKKTRKTTSAMIDRLSRAR